MSTPKYTRPLDWLIALVVTVGCCLPVWRTLRQDSTSNGGGNALARDTASPREMPINPAPVIDQVAVQAACNVKNPTEVSMPEAPAAVQIASETCRSPERSSLLPASSEQIQQPLDIAASLPPTERTAFLDAVAEGESLLQMVGDGEIPGYACRVELSLLDRLVRDQVARVVVQSTAHEPEVFVFEARSLSALGRPHLVLGAHDLVGYSSRVVWLNAGDLPQAAEAIASEFGFPRHTVRAGFVLRSDLDKAVLAAQARAARDAGLALNDVALTDGRFAIASGVPFSYRVSRLATRGVQRWIDISDSASVTVPERVAQGG